MGFEDLGNAMEGCEMREHGLRTNDVEKNKELSRVK